ncbi:MAG: regulator SirB, partial [Proteobacteria bacterium]|nr:regulator SirB [Pseudomonadota bacterium]
MAIGLSISPLTHPWLAVKLLAIVVYIIIGSIALKRGRTRGQRVAALLLSLLVLIVIFAVALHHDPWAGLR